MRTRLENPTKKQAGCYRQWDAFTDEKRLIKAMQKVERIPESGCWIWMGSQQRGGSYGKLRTTKGKTYAHRFFYEQLVGPVGDDKYVCHRCDVRCCVNPAHLFLGTHADNMADMAKKGRARKIGAKGERHGMSLLTDADVIEIRKRESPAAALAKQFGVARATIYWIWSGWGWKHLD